MGQGVEAGIELIVAHLDKVMRDDMKTTVLLETMAGKGSEVGVNLDELATIIDGVEKKHDGKAGVDGGQTGRAVGGKVAHHPGVHHIVKLLEQVARHDRQGKENDFFENGAPGQIPVFLRPQGALFLCHTKHAAF